MSILLEPFELKNLQLKNKVIMAPMTRNSADDNLVPTQEMAEYYARRADAGLIISEGTIIRPDGRGYSNVPGIFTQEQIAGWQKVTTKVHQKDGKIFLQIWHVGRVSHPNFLNGQLPISASETMMTGKVKRADNLIYGKSRAVTLNDIESLIESYAIAAKNAIAAGFDGIEIHGANGYLIDQFLHYSTNLRTDKYGGSPENMSRFAVEVVKACGDAIGYERVGIRLSPGAYLNEIVGDPRDAFVFQNLFQQLNALPIAYVHTGNFDDKKTFSELNDKTMTEFIRQYYKGTVIACGSYAFSDAEAGISENKFDLVAMGRPFIANPNLINLFKRNSLIQTYYVDMLKTLN